MDLVFFLDESGKPRELPFPAHEPILFVANPTSRSGKAAERIDVACRLLDQVGLKHVMRHTLPAGGTVELVRRAVAEEGFRTIVYLGGDGTFAEVAKGICRSGAAAEVRLGMLPAGTANDQGKSFGVSSSAKALEENIQVIARGFTVQLDVGEVTALSDDGVELRRDLFFDSLGWGLSAAILSFRNRELEIIKKVPVVRDMYRDHAVYVRAAVHELALNWLTRDHFNAEVVADGAVHTLEGLTDLVVNNTALYAGDWLIDPDSRADDGYFEITPFCGVADWTSKLILHHKKVPLTEEMVNRIGVSHTKTFRGARVQIDILRPHKDKRPPAQLDGEEFLPADRFSIEVHPRRLSLIVPEKHHWI